MVQTATCPACNGRGETISSPCKTCRGGGLERKNVTKKVQIPAGVDRGTQIRLAGEGGPGVFGGPHGNLFLVLDVKPHKFFKRRENDILLNLGLIETKVAWTASNDTAMIAVLIVDIWKTAPFMALLCLAGLQMVPRDIYEAARIDGVHPVKVFWKITLPLIRPALMVAVIFRMLDALRIFDLVYVLTPNSAATKTMSVISRENLFEFNNFAYGSAQSTLLFAILAIFVALYIWLGKVNLSGEGR
jgi:hypothetical protein